MILSICIPSYNRPATLLRLLNSIDCTRFDEIEIVICEDKSPKRKEVREVVDVFISKTQYKVNYIENLENYGFDKNLRELIRLAKGDFIMYMGDDDYFVKGSLDGFISFLEQNPDKGYVLKTWINLHENGWEEPFNYYDGRKYFEPSVNTFVSLFRISTFVSGFTFKREYSIPYLVDKFDSTLLFQLYLLGELTLKYDSVFYEVPLTIQTKQKADVPHFGSSETEKGLYTPGVITIENSINFLKGYFKITEYLDNTYNLNSTELVKKDMTKYSYSYLYLQRDKKIKDFTRFYKLLKNEVGLDTSFHIDFYYIALLIFGRNICNDIIFIGKKLLKKTPNS